MVKTSGEALTVIDEAISELLKLSGNNKLRDDLIQAKQILDRKSNSTRRRNVTGPLWQDCPISEAENTQKRLFSTQKVC